MRVHIVSPSADRTRNWQQALTHAVRIYEVTTSSGGLASAEIGLRATPPDVLVLQPTHEADIDLLQSLAQDHPNMDCVLLGTQPDPAQLMGLMRAGVREVLPEVPDGVQLSMAVERLARRRGGSLRHTKRGKVLCFMSCKGGSGATFLAANLAVALAEQSNARVALIDLNLQFGDALLFISSQTGPSNVAEVALNSERLDKDLLRSSLLEVSPGLFALAAPNDPASGTDVLPEQVQTLLQVARSDFDYVVVDIGRTLNGVALQALDMADQVYAVLQLTLPFIRDGKRLQELFRSLDYPPSKIHWVLNRFEKGGQLTLSDLRQSLKTPELITIPNHYGVVADSVNQGVPVSKVAPRSPVTKALADMADSIRNPDVTEATTSGIKGLLSKVFDKRGIKVA
ncbi:MAG: AAA family ATPase [Proteobacteria bacterium]|uniref:CpaE family protein n=1 Tax=Aquabacterium sp. TaxID=1872578 RepID=UPI0035C7149B|nr:AAA family ATPase [Pseudomonadota bacterium]